VSEPELDVKTVAEVAHLLHLSQDTVRRMATRGDLRASRLGGRWLFRKTDLDIDLDEFANRAPTRRRRRRAA